MTARANSGKPGPMLTVATLENPQELRRSVSERMKLGKQLRATVPRKSHGEYSPPPSRRDPMTILEEQAKTRINDFDETLPAPWEWDLKRLAASAVVCARYLGGDAEDCEAAAQGPAEERTGLTSH
jgi:Uncharacterized protein conserved in bacteria (DUF2252)